RDRERERFAFSFLEVEPNSHAFGGLVGLTAETICISACIAILSAVPLFLEVARRYSKLFFLLGTGALSGILAFDLIPDLFELGGSSSL
ncbi:hypothetical protein ABTF50_19990, partial [Acinetobacter baumannii]